MARSSPVLKDHKVSNLNEAAHGRPSVFNQRRAGVCLHLTALPGNHGIGEIGRSAFQFIDSLAKMNVSVWQFLPIGPTGFGNSPYQSLSTFAGNELLIAMPELVQSGLLTESEIRPLTRLPGTTVAFEKLIPIKTALLDRAAKRFLARGSPDLQIEFECFLKENDQSWLHDYALFRVLKSLNREKQWTQWAGGYHVHDRRALPQFASRERKSIERVKVIQFLFYHQWRQLRQYASDRGVLLFGDMPIYIALDSADAWASPEMLQIDRNGVPDRVAGVPPDYFCADGQRWGNPLYQWPWHANDRYRWWIERLRHATRQADLTRVDHFRGFEAFFGIPHEATTAREGQWYKGPGDALFNALNAALGELSIVAEDLGDITPPVTALRLKHGIPGMKVLQFEVLRESFDVGDIEENCVCYTGTHDNDTTVGWYRGNSDAGGNNEPARIRKVIRDACQGRARTIHMDLIRLAFSSPARIAIAPLQDYLGLGSRARFNTPGTDQNCWRWRMNRGDPGPALSESVAQLVEDHGRAAKGE